MLNVVSLFAGAGISDLGFHNAGLKCLAQVENDPNANNVRKRHFDGNILHHGQIETFDGRQFKGEAHILAGGFPCQDYSLASDNRAGLAGDKGALWWQMYRVAKECESEFIVGENVPGLLSADGGRSFGTIIKSLVDIGYRVAWRVLDLQYMGVPQRRRRLILVASLGSGAAANILFDSELLPKFAPTDRKASENGFPNIANGFTGGSLEVYNVRRDESKPGKENLSITPIDSVSSLTAIRPSENSHQSQVIIVQNNTVRRLSILERERLMGLPDGFTRYGVDGTKIKEVYRHKMIGNGWAVPQAEWVMRRVIEYASKR